MGRRAIVRVALVAAAAIACGPSAPAGAQDGGALETYAEGFAFLTNIAIAPDGRIFATEKERGTVLIVTEGAEPQEFFQIEVHGGAERGLLGIELHPAYPIEPWVYLYLSDARDERNRVIRVRDENGRGAGAETVIDLLPSVAGYHNGGDMVFGPDGKLYVVTGEAHDPERAQAPEDLGGKVLRLNPDGSIPEDNPFGPTSPVYSLGHRNSFGLCVEPSGVVWETENGPSSHDEVNRVVAGANYGWPVVSGPGGGGAFVDPVIDYPDIIVPTGCAVAGGTLFWGDYHGTLHSAPIQGEGLGAEHTQDAGGEVTDVAAGADGYLYVVNPNRIQRVRVAGASTPATTSPPASPATTGPTTASPSPAGDEDGGNAVPIALAVVVILIGLGVAAWRWRPGASEP